MITTLPAIQFSCTQLKRYSCMSPSCRRKWKRLANRRHRSLSASSETLKDFTTKVLTHLPLALGILIKMNYQHHDHPRIKKHQLRKAPAKNMRRLAAFLRLRRIDEMSDGQLVRLLDWYFKRPMKRAAGLAWSCLCKQFVVN